MDMLQIAEHLKVGHLVSNRRGTDAEVVPPRDGARADRLRRFDIILHYRLQDALFPFIHITCPSC